MNMNADTAITILVERPDGKIDRFRTTLGNHEAGVLEDAVLNVKVDNEVDSISVLYAPGHWTRARIEAKAEATE